MKILYVVSTLKASGPTNQLYSLIKELPVDTDIYILTLSNEEENSRIDDFKLLNVKVLSLGLGRFKSLFSSKTLVNEVIRDLKPSVVHSQGIRADIILSKMNLNTFSWFSTSHNFPYEDYLMKFGRLRGMYMAKSHIKAFKRCKNLISCSKTIRNKLESVNVYSKAIQNGIDTSIWHEGIFRKNESLADIVFISVGSLIPRKNMSYILAAFEKAKINSHLYVLGDGVEYDLLKSKFTYSTISFEGNVDNVKSYLDKADIFISSSLSEGLPNTVLEALASGKVCYLSDIDSHREVQEVSKGSVHLFPLDDNGEKLAEYILNSVELLSESNFEDAKQTVMSHFTSKHMSEQYFKYYLKERA